MVFDFYFDGVTVKTGNNVCENEPTNDFHDVNPFVSLLTRVPHARHACLVLDFPEPNCDWSKKNDVIEIVCGFVFADVIFRRRDTKAGNTSVFAGRGVFQRRVLRIFAVD